MADSPTIIYKGYTFRGTVQLRKKPNSNSEAVNPYPMPVGAVVTVKFPGMQLTTTDSEVTINDSNLSTISFVAPIAKSALMTAGDNAAVDVIVSSSGGTVLEAFEALKVYHIRTLKN